MLRMVDADILTTSYPLDRDPQRTKRIIERLELPIPMSFPNETPLEDVLKHMKQATATPTQPGFPIYVDPLGMQEADKTLTSPVKIDLGRVPLKTSLRLILKQLGLTYTVKDGYLMITSEESVDQQIEFRVDADAEPTIIPHSTPGDGGMTGGGIGVSGMTSIPALVAALYRAGRFEDAIRRLEERIKLRNRADEPINWTFLAMAHHHLGNRDEARRWLDRLRAREPNTNPNEFWNELAIGLLRSEAEAVILYDPIFPADPFAH